MVSKDFDVGKLRVIPLFAGMAEGQLEELRPGLKVLSMEAGDVVVREGDSADRLFVLVSGEVQVVKNYLQPGAQTVDVLAPGSYFGEMALVGTDSQRSATVVTTEPCHFMTLQRDTFQAILRAHPELAISMLEETFRRLRQANDLLATMQQELEAQA